MDRQPNSDIVRRMWDLYASGRPRDLLEHVDPDVEWHPLVNGTVCRGREELGRWASDVQTTWKSVVVVLEGMSEAPEERVVAFGRIVAFDHGGEQDLDSPIAWVLQFRESRVVHARAFRGRADAEAWVSARPERP
ncbi:MAG: SnoaL-like domain [Solirubrobacteraceae bacterium]|jgi:ketosteroid isomerase-like protein|nr:SnoaL-like domain [Solirubrobacteraceae bacterium]MEA2276463.1 SnoaL-like domain [Solirubrobacteraceae bacterium]MEA2358959.1 SnoaL-like domain [Solirubrobacteraceae bacterium]